LALLPQPKQEELNRLLESWRAKEEAPK